MNNLFQDSLRLSRVVDIISSQFSPADKPFKALIENNSAMTSDLMLKYKVSEALYLMIETCLVPETLDICSGLKGLIAREDFIAFRKFVSQSA
jgi:hypothetical protein